VILSSALFKNYLTLLVVATYVIAPLPNWICSRAANPDDFMESSGSGVIDFGRFLTGFFVVMGIGEWISVLMGHTGIRKGREEYDMERVEHRTDFYYSASNAIMAFRTNRWWSGCYGNCRRPVDIFNDY
jgi:hypothetical protein